MIIFYEASTLWQITLLVLSQFTVITLAGSFIILFKRKSNVYKQIVIGLILLIHIVLYVLMQLDSGITGAGLQPYLLIPYLVLLIATLSSLILDLWIMLSETRNRKSINHNSIKESFDNLPMGVCFFNEAGLPILCNLTMQRFCFQVCGKDIQFITDLESCLEENFIPVAGTVREGAVFVVPNGIAWYLEKRRITRENGTSYIQYLVTDVTELHKNRVELVKENEQLQKVQTELKQLSANVMTVTREEEILNTKMRVHDEMGKCLLTAQKYLKEGMDDGVEKSVIASWQRAVSMLKYNNDVIDEDLLSQIRKTCESVKLSFVQKGELPKEESTAYLLSCAVRECVTNAVRYAEADKLYVDFIENEKEAMVVVRNNGKIPNKQIVEGGGLSTLRRRVEGASGTMSIQSFPEFKLTVTIPKRRKSVL